MNTPFNKYRAQFSGRITWAVLFTFFFAGLTAFAAEQITQVGALAVPRKDHTATVLMDNRVLILGGQTASGELASAEVFDPETRTFSSVGSMSSPRVQHAATLLPNGTILITGGRNALGALATAEIYDPRLSATVTFRTLPSTMRTARENHSSTVLANGLVLIAGGDFAGTGELYDPVAETFSSSIMMITARSGQTATTLPEDSVLLAGGGTRSVELFDIQTNAFLSWTAALNESRTLQSAITAADGSIYFVGGEPSGTLEKFDLLSGSGGSLNLGSFSSAATQLANGKILVTGPALASLFTPATGVLSPIANASLLQRSGQTVTELMEDKKILVVGGVDATAAYVAPAALYNPAKIVTDKADYYPDEPVIVYGSGWKPAENVDLYVVDDLGWVYDSTVTADASGQFTADPYFVVLWQHLGVTFDLTAIGAQSGIQAKHTFTDSPRVASVTVGPQFGTLNAGNAGSVTFLVTVDRGTSNAAFTTNLSVTSVLPTGVTASFLPSTLSFSGAPNPTQTLTSTLTLSTTSSSPAGSTPVTVTATDSNNESGTGTLVILPAKITPTLSVTNSPVTYNGSPQAGSVSGSVAGTVNNIKYDGLATVPSNAGTYVVTANFIPTDTTTYNSLTDAQAGNFVIEKAASTTTVTINGGPFTYTGSALTPATVQVTGAGGLSLTPDAVYANNTNAGTATASYSYAESANHLASSDSKDFIIAKAATATVVTIVGGPFTYTGSALTPATVQVTGAGGLSLTPDAVYANNTNAGTATASYSYAESANHLASSDSKDFTIAKAATATVVTIIGGPFTYTGSALTPATVQVTGAGGLSLTPDAVYANNTNAGTATASYSYAESANHLASSDSENFTIGKASSTTTVTIVGGPFTYTGAGQTPATVTVTGAGGLNLTPAATYVNNVNAGTATASYSYAESANHRASSDSENFTIGKAASMTTVTIVGGPFTYTGAAQTPATVTVTGAGGLNLTPAATYVNNVNAGTATASYSYAESANHLASSDSENFTIGKAASMTTVTIVGGPFTYTGLPHTPATVTVTGAGGLNLTPAATYVNNVNAGTATASYNYVGSDNYEASSDSKNFTIGQASALLITISFDDLVKPFLKDTAQLPTIFVSPAITHKVEFIQNGVIVSTNTGVIPVGVYTVRVTTTDPNYYPAIGEALFVIYDPSAGFVTGGGWINSPVGASTLYPEAIGKANFGFNSKYQKGANIPTGQTQFEFKAGNLNFHSTSYEWLTVAGARAQYKGEGTVNGAGTYGFMLTAIDGQVNGGGGIDKFRIKIWEKVSGTIVYDNQPGETDDAGLTAAGTLLGGGSIVIHDGGKK